MYEGEFTLDFWTFNFLCFKQTRVCTSTLTVCILWLKQAYSPWAFIYPAMNYLSNQIKSQTSINKSMER